MEEITTDRELSKQLKEVGFPQDNIYACKHSPDLNDESFNTVTSPIDAIIKREHEWIASPTAEELLKELPGYVIKDDIKYRFYVEYNAALDNIYCGYRCMEKDNMFMPLFDRRVEQANLCIPFAEIYIYLANNNLLRSE